MIEADRPALPPAISSGRVVAIARGVPADRLPALAAALREAGVPALEVTLGRADALDGIAALSASGIAVGAGTVLDLADARDAVAAGAGYLVSPHLDAELVRWAAGRGVPVLPGALTPTEILAAWRAGAAAVKLFPATSVGPSYLSALHGPLPDVLIVPTGGVTADNAAAWLAAGAAAVGVGGWLVGDGDPGSALARGKDLMAAIGG